MSVAEAAPSQQPGADAALLWDFDNVVVPGVDLSGLAAALSALVPAGAPRLAAAHWRAYKTHKALLREHGYRVLFGGHLPDGADEILLRHARRLRRNRGISHFVVASNDHVFAAIAKRSVLDVVTLDPTRLSERLRARAASVIVLTRTATGWAPARPPQEGITESR